MVTIENYKENFDGIIEGRNRKLTLYNFDFVWSGKKVAFVFFLRLPSITRKWRNFHHVERRRRTKSQLNNFLSNIKLWHEKR